MQNKKRKPVLTPGNLSRELAKQASGTVSPDNDVLMP